MKIEPEAVLNWPFRFPRSAEIRQNSAFSFLTAGNAQWLYLLSIFAHYKHGLAPLYAITFCSSKLIYSD